MTGKRLSFCWSIIITTAPVCTKYRVIRNAQESKRTRASGRMGCRADVHTKQGAGFQTKSVRQQRGRRQRGARCKLESYHLFVAAAASLGPGSLAQDRSSPTCSSIVWLPPIEAGWIGDAAPGGVSQALYHVAIARKSVAVSGIDVVLPPQASPWMCRAGEREESDEALLRVLCGGNVVRRNSRCWVCFRIGRRVPICSRLRR